MEDIIVILLFLHKYCARDFSKTIEPIVESIFFTDDWIYMISIYFVFVILHL